MYRGVFWPQERKSERGSVPILRLEAKPLKKVIPTVVFHQQTVECTK
jgi:hypothetical protein